jgi:DNA-binding GntR family transcriptional regulator
MSYSTISETIFHKIRADLISGKLKPGEKINQNQLTEELGFSLIPLREALRRLEAEGYITIAPHRGAFVKEVSREELDDIYRVRAVVEELAAGLAIGKMTDEVIAELRTLVKKMRAATRKRDIQHLLSLNKEFHFTIYMTSNRKHLLSIISDLWDRSSRYRNLQTLLPNRNDQALAEHDEILRACEDRDKKRLMKAIRFNVEQTRRVLISAQNNPSNKRRTPQG